MKIEFFTVYFVLITLIIHFRRHFHVCVCAIEAFPFWRKKNILYAKLLLRSPAGVDMVQCVHELFIFSIFCAIVTRTRFKLWKNDLAKQTKIVHPVFFGWLQGRQLRAAQNIQARTKTFSLPKNGPIYIFKTAWSDSYIHEHILMHQAHMWLWMQPSETSFRLQPWEEQLGSFTTQYAEAQRERGLSRHTGR